MQWLSKLILLSVSLFSFHAPAQAPYQPLTKTQLHDTTYRIVQKNLLDDSLCSASAIGPHALLTDAHCAIATDGILVNGFSATIVKRMYDDRDHCIYLVNGLRFVRVARVGDSSTIKEGDLLYFWGNPNGWTGLYREGHIAGFDVYHGVNIILVDANIGKGDSGSGLFNREGDIVSTVSLNFSDSTPFHIAGSFPLMFSEKQLAEAVRF